jgi:hypothetical protein
VVNIQGAGDQSQHDGFYSNWRHGKNDDGLGIAKQNTNINRVRKIASRLE